MEVLFCPPIRQKPGNITDLTDWNGDAILPSVFERLTGNGRPDRLTDKMRLRLEHSSGMSPGARIPSRLVFYRQRRTFTTESYRRTKDGLHWSGVWCITSSTPVMKSLILAQDERWRRA